jgi:hypothetical protein
MYKCNARYSADPVDLGAQSDLICAPEPMSIEAVLADQLGSVTVLLRFDVTPQLRGLGWVMASSQPVSSAV